MRFALLKDSEIALRRQRHLLNGWGDAAMQILLFLCLLPDSPKDFD